MNQETSSPKESIHDSWNTFEAPFKDQLQVNDQNELILLPNEFRKEKKLGVFQPEQWKQEVQKLHAGFEELMESAQALKEKWETSEDKLALKMMVHQFEKKLQSTDAIGDYHPIREQMALYQGEIDRLLEQNAEERQKIVDTARQLSRSEDWHEATEHFKQLIEIWRVAPEVRKQANEKMWQEISDAKDVFFERKRKHYEDLEKEQMVNLDRKIELCEKAEAMQDSEDWKNTTEQLNALMEEWKTIGPLPSVEKNDEMWERFNGARKTFFDRKHDHSEQIRQEQEHNYKEKLALVEEAEQLSTSTQWKATSERLDKMQQQWNSLGRAPKEFNDLLWERWKSARNSFYEAKRSQAREFLQNLNENYEKKKALTERAEHLAQSENWRLATDELMQMMTEWKIIGPIPKEYGDELWDRFNIARRTFFKRKDEDRERRRTRYEQKNKDRLNQTEKFLHTLQQELKDDEDQLAEFTESIEGLNEEHKKDKELKDHLAHLISKLERNIIKRKAKIDDVQKQLEELNDQDK